MRRSVPVAFLAVLVLALGVVGAPALIRAQDTPAAPTPPPAPTAPTAAPTARASGNTVPVDLEIHAEVRHRWELDGKAKFNADAVGTEFSLLRSRLSVEAELPKGVSIFLQGQDARTWGEEPSTLSGSGGSGDMHQGYFMARDLFAPGVWAKVGRMELHYGNGRLIGAANWSNTGRAFDGVVAGYKAAMWSLDLFETKVAEGVGDNARGKDRDFFGAYATIDPVPMHHVDLFGFYDHDKDTLATGEEIEKRLTVGGRAHGMAGPLQYEGEAAFQTGEQAGLDVSASLLAAKLGYEVAHPYKPALWAGVDVLSGDEDPADDEVGVFENPFTSGHGIHGDMDFFIDIPSATQGAGLIDFFIKASIAPAPWLTASLKYHNLQAAEDLVVTTASGEEKLSSFGNEIDLTAKVRCTDNVHVQSGFSFFAPGDIFDTAATGNTLFRGEDSAYWGYLQTTVSY
jgi:hypothetical protein